MIALAALIAWNDNNGLRQTIAALRRGEMIRATAAAVPSGMTVHPAHLAAITVSIPMIVGILLGEKTAHIRIFNNR